MVTLVCINRTGLSLIAAVDLDIHHLLGVRRVPRSPYVVDVPERTQGEG